jgi:hypothetical protein
MTEVAKALEQVRSVCSTPSNQSTVFLCSCPIAGVPIDYAYGVLYRASCSLRGSKPALEERSSRGRVQRCQAHSSLASSRLVMHLWPCATQNCQHPHQQRTAQGEAVWASHVPASCMAALQ